MNERSIQNREGLREVGGREGGFSYNNSYVAKWVGYPWDASKIRETPNKPAAGKVKKGQFFVSPKINIPPKIYFGI